MTTTCTRCGGRVTSRSVACSDARVGPVLAVVEARIVAHCPSCTADGPSGDTGNDAVRSAVEQGLRFAVRERRADRCGACGEALDLPMRASTRSVTVEPADAPPFTVTFSLPLVRCGDCATDNVPSALRAGVREAARGAVAGSNDALDGRGPSAAAPFGRRVLSRLRLLSGRGSRARP
jgi:hypothetical protein